MIERHDGRQQIVCDSCPASQPGTYPDDAFDVMVSDAKAAGWNIARRKPPDRDRDTSDLFNAPPRIAGGKPASAWLHTCPACLAAAPLQRPLF